MDRAWAPPGWWTGGRRNGRGWGFKGQVAAGQITKARSARTGKSAQQPAGKPALLLRSNLALRAALAGRASQKGARVLGTGHKLRSVTMNGRPRPIFLRTFTQQSKEFYVYGDSRHSNATGHDHQAQ